MGLSDSSVLAILFLWDFSFSKSWENGELSVLQTSYKTFITFKKGEICHIKEST